MKKWLGRLAKISFFLIAFLGVIITVLFNMGGDSDTLKGAIQDYISATTGYATKIEHLNKMTFFPNVMADMDGVLLKKPDIAAMQAWAEIESQKPESERGLVPPPIGYGNPDATIEKLIISVGFWDVVFGKARKFRNIQMRNAQFNAGTVHFKPLKIDMLGIDETAEGQAYIGLNGTLGADEMDATLDLEASGSRNKRKYTLGEEGVFSFNVGGISINAIMRPRTMGGLHLRDLKLVNNGQDVMNATFSFVLNGGEMMDIDGEFQMDEFDSKGEFDIQINRKKNMQILGEIDGEFINQADFASGSKFSRAWQEWNRIFKNPNAPANDNNAIAFESETFVNTTTIDNYKGAARINENTITFTTAIPQSINGKNPDKEKSE